MNSMHGSKCFFCYLELGSKYLQAETLDFDKHVCQAAEYLEDTTSKQKHQVKYTEVKMMSLLQLYWPN